ncbi:flagellar type III secretion system protein FlhB [uncultured Algimonas sp.]|uniref:flagellar type III secretion system protein FlhB n=1 Tax=uncultured Algimonas sp. TaxID=1547920 RepID=UPI002635E81B|nr:flagellar type III secretion system protein FlhB [uncultured Algimonas sp.]
MSEDNDSGQEKSFEATQGKIDEARRKGDVAKSSEIASVALYAGLAISVMTLGGTVGMQMLSRLSGLLEYPERASELVLEGGAGADLLGSVALVLVPILLIMMASVLAALAVQRSIIFAPDKIMPKLSKISPISNAKQKYGRDGMAEFAKRAVKLIIICVAAGAYLIRLAGDVSNEIGRPEGYLFSKLAGESLLLLGWMIAATCLIAAVDMPFAQWSHLLKLRMTREEVKDENKKNEGDPLMKSQRRAKAREIANSTMLADVATANVVIVNPTHYSVALRWNREAGGAPVCVAKGVDSLAFAIRERAKAHGVLIHSDPPCARAVHATVEVGAEIRPEHYAAVASAIHLAETLSRKGDY